MQFLEGNTCHAISEKKTRRYIIAKKRHSNFLLLCSWSKQNYGDLEMTAESKRRSDLWYIKFCSFFFINEIVQFSKQFGFICLFHKMCTRMPSSEHADISTVDDIYYSKICCRRNMISCWLDMPDVKYSAFSHPL